MHLKAVKKRAPVRVRGIDEKKKLMRTDKVVGATRVKTPMRVERKLHRE